MFGFTKVISLANASQNNALYDEGAKGDIGEALTRTLYLYRNDNSHRVNNRIAASRLVVHQYRRPK